MIESIEPMPSSSECKNGSSDEDDAEVENSLSDDIFDRANLLRIKLKSGQFMR